MTQEQLLALIQELKADGDPDRPYFVIFKDVDNPDDYGIHANGKGLRWYAAQLLEAAVQAQAQGADGDTKEIFHRPVVDGG